MNHPTLPAPPEPERLGPAIPGTIGFEICLLLIAPRYILKLPALPADLGQLVDYYA